FAETVERGGKIKLCITGKRAQAFCGVLGTVFDCQKLRDERALFRAYSGALSQSRLLEKTLGDLARRASASGRNTCDCEQILNEGARAPLIRALDERKQAGMRGGAAAIRWAQDHIEGFAVREAAGEAAAPFRRKAERLKQVCEKAAVTDPHPGRVFMGPFHGPA